MFKRSIIAFTRANKLINQKLSVARIFSRRAFASAHPRLETSVLLRNIKKEIKSQKSIVEDQPEELDPKVVLANNESFLKENNWTLLHPEGSTLITLNSRDTNLEADISIKFDLVDVFNELSQAEEDTEEMEMDNEEEIVEDDLAEHEVDEIDQFVSLPFTLEIKRDSLPEKTLQLECLINGNKNQNEIVIDNIAVVPLKESKDISAIYTSPNFADLDEQFKSSFDDFVSKLVKSDDLMNFMKEYSIASEASMYQNWLSDLTNILKADKA